MEARKFFQAVREAEEELKILNAKLAHYEDIGLNIGSPIGRIGGNSNRSASRVELAAIGAVDVFRDLINQQRDYLAIIARAEGIIRQIPQEKYRKILTYLYLIGKTPKWVSDEMGYSDPNSVYRAKGWALYEAQKIINKQESEDDGKMD